VTLDDVQAIAFQCMALPQPTKTNLKVDVNAAIYKYWLAHKEVGTPITKEYDLADNTRAQVMSTGRVLHWLGGDDVEVV